MRQRGVPVPLIGGTSNAQGGIATLL